MNSAHFTPQLPSHINTGPWVAGYSLPALKDRIGRDRIVLPICSLGTSSADLASLAPLVLPPLYHEALDADLKAALIAQIRRCFPYFEGTQARRNFRGSLEVVELLARRPAPPVKSPRLLAFGVDTTVEQHGPHLPLGTDTVQTYAVLQQLASERDGLVIGPPLDYGHLTWGLPFGLSIDLTPGLAERYVCSFVNAVLDWLQPAAMYVADVHGSVGHRKAMQDGLGRSRATRWAFRWLHDPLVEFAGDRGDTHAGGVETTLVQHINPQLVDSNWWPARKKDLAAAQMKTADAIALSTDLSRFIVRVEAEHLNGIVGDVYNADRLDAAELMRRMLAIARKDVDGLLSA